MWEVDHALAAHTRFTQLDKGRWRADYEGFVTVTAEGDTPTESERQLHRAMDMLLASLIRGGEGWKPSSMATMTNSLVLSDAVKVVNNCAKKTAELKQKERERLAGEPEAPAEDPVAVGKPRKRRSERQR